jgi:ribosome-binding factor A
MEELLARARAADADVARVREGAKPAGEADPYRTPPADDAGWAPGRGESGQSDSAAEDAGDDDQLED